MIMLALVLGFMQVSMALAEEAMTKDADESTGIPMPKGADPDHNVHIWFCASWGSKRNFVQVREWIHQNFPELKDKVTGANMPAPPVVELLFKLLSFVQLAGLIVVIVGSNVFRLLGFSQVPTWYYSIEKNGFQLAIVVYLLLPQILSKYLVTGAFEIVLDGDNTIFSKLETGRLPQYADLVDPLVAAGLRLVAPKA